MSRRERHKFYALTENKYQYLNLFVEVLEFLFWNQIITLTKRWVFYCYQFIYVMTTNNFLKDDTVWYELRLSQYLIRQLSALCLSFRFCLQYPLFYSLLWCFVNCRTSTYVLSERDVSVRMSSPIMTSMTWAIEWWDKIGSDTLVIHEMIDFEKSDIKKTSWKKSDLHHWSDYNMMSSYL